MTRVLAFGTFDIVHLGHLSLFTQAKALGDHLTVVVATDERVHAIKGAYPIHTQAERCTFLKHVIDIDDVRLGHATDVYQSVREVAPDIIALGYDQRVFVDALEAKLATFGLDQTTIVRLKPYKEHREKTSVLKAQLQSML